MKKLLAFLLAVAALIAALSGCEDHDNMDKIPETSGMTQTETVFPEQTDRQEPVVVSEVERETAEDGTEYVTSLTETTYPDGMVAVESNSEILYPDGSAYCESQQSIYHVDGSKTVELSTTRTDAEGIVTVLEQRILEYDAEGKLVGEK